MLSIKQIGTICFAIFSFIFPSFGYVENNDPCTDDTLNTYSGSANLTANWNANEIELHWYNGNDEIENIASVSQSCVYDGTLTPPATIPTREGYTFRGWRPRSCFSGLDTNINGEVFASRCRFSSMCSGASQSQISCSDSRITGLNDEWAVFFGNDMIKGVSYCSAKSGDNHDFSWGGNSSDWSATESELTSTSGERIYCWCKAASFTPNGGAQCNVSSPVWVFSGTVDYYNTDIQRFSGCLEKCGSYARDKSSFRRALFGVQ